MADLMLQDESLKDKEKGILGQDLLTFSGVSQNLDEVQKTMMLS